MEIITIFADHLYSVKFQKKGVHEFAKIFDTWQDSEILFGFFEENKNDLKSGYFGKITIEEAVLMTIDEADDLQQYLLKVGRSGNKKILDVFFKNNLHEKNKITELIPKKAYGNKRKSWLRLYAVELSKECYVITGGAIKLTKKMQDRPHTNRELKKIEKLIAFLKENGIYDNKGIKETIDQQ